MVGNTPDDKPQIRLRINVIEFGRSDQTIDCKPAHRWHLRIAVCYWHTFC